MMEIECPFCDRPVAVDLAAFQSPSFSLRCDGYAVDVAFDAPVADLALAA